MKGHNKYGRAGKRGVPASTVVAFLDHYTYEGLNPEPVRVGQLGSPDNGRAKRINGITISAATQRAIRRWRNGQVEHVSVLGVSHVLAEFGFDLPWFHGWCKLHRKPIT
jgi:hypothetical protein